MSIEEYLLDTGDYINYVKRSDTIGSILILKNKIQPGWSQHYKDRLCAMNDAELDAELKRIKEVAAYGFVDVGGLTYDEVRYSSRGD